MLKIRTINQTFHKTSNVMIKDVIKIHLLYLICEKERLS